MRKPPDALTAGMDAFARNAAIRMAAMGITGAEVARIVKKRSGAQAPSAKTVNNALAARHDSKVSTLSAIADALEVPLWMMLLPNIAERDLRSPMKERIAALVENYLKCDDDGRSRAEKIAEAYADAKKT